MTYPLGNRGRDSFKESRPRLPSGYVIIIIITINIIIIIIIIIWQLRWFFHYYIDVSYMQG